MMDAPLACPRCDRRYPLSERFCVDDGMPLVYAGSREQQPITDSHERARKVKPQYRRGELVKVAGGRNLAEAELIQNILLEEGIPSTQRRTRGFDVPDFLAAGPRDILVPEAAYEDARALLSDVDALEPAAALEADDGDYPLRLLVGVLIAVAAAGAIVWLLYQAVS
jgi:hypothetical protein